MGGESWMRKQDEEEAAGQRSEMLRDAEGPMRMDDKSNNKNKKVSAEYSVSWMPPEDSGKRSGMQRGAEEPTGTLRKAKKKKKKPGKRKEDPIGSHQIGDKCYEGVTLQHAVKLFRDYEEKKIKKKNRNKGDSRMPPDQAGTEVGQQSVTSPETTEESVKKDARKLFRDDDKTKIKKKNRNKGDSRMQPDQAGTEVGQQLVTSPETTKEYVNGLNSCESGKRSETAPLPDFYSGLPPEFREELKALLDIQDKLTSMGLLKYVNKKTTENKRSQNSLGGLPDEAENDLGRKKLKMSGSPEPEVAQIDLLKRMEMWRISRDRLLDAEIHKALLHIHDKLRSKETNMIDKDTLQLLEDVSYYRLDVLDEDDQNGEMGKLAIADQTCLNTSDHSGNSPSLMAKKTVAEVMAQELEAFASHWRLWEDKFSKTCGTFTEATLLSSMQFTHYTPGRTPNTECSTRKTLQIISIQLTELADGLEFPLSVYGVVAVRDVVDRNRNVLFFRNSYEAQELNQNDNFLHLIGPSRAVVFTNKVWIEIELRVKGGAYSQNEALISRARRYNGRKPGVSTVCFKNALCALELRLHPVEKAVQATILGVQAAEDDGSWPFRHGGLVACTPRSGTLRFTDVSTPEIDPSSNQIVLIESKDDAMPKGQNGHVLLRRQVVSVNLEGRLDVVIKAYSKSGAIVAETCVCFDPEVCNISQKKFSLGVAKGAVTVAWSRVAASKTDAAGGLPDEAENELGRKRLEMPRISREAHRDQVKIKEMMRISRDRLRDAEIHKALLDIQYKLTRKETSKIDKNTLRLLKDVSHYEFYDDHQNGEMDKLAIADQTGLNTSDHSGYSPLLVAKKTVAKVMAQELEIFASHRRLWERKWSKTCGIFTAATRLSSMQFTHYTPGRISNTECSTRTNLQIISIQLTELADSLEFPLSVYGVVAVRDIVDCNRNVLFFRNSHEAQELEHNDNFLHLIGPSRAVVFTDMVWIEIELRVKEGVYSRNEALISCARRYSGGNPGVSTICVKNALCTLELCLQPVEKAVQATILGVQVATDDGSWPFQYGGLVACTPQLGTLRFTDVITREIDPSSTQIVLIESKDDAMPEGENGYVLLRRQVVSVNREGRFDVVIKAYDKYGAIGAKTCVCFDPAVCNISQKKFSLGDAKGAVTVAWSRVAASMTGAAVELNGMAVR